MKTAKPTHILEKPLGHKLCLGFLPQFVKRGLQEHRYHIAGCTANSTLGYHGLSDFSGAPQIPRKLLSVSSGLPRKPPSGTPKLRSEHTGILSLHPVLREDPESLGNPIFSLSRVTPEPCTGRVPDYASGREP